MIIAMDETNVQSLWLQRTQNDLTVSRYGTLPSSEESLRAQHAEGHHGNGTIGNPQLQTAATDSLCQVRHCGHHARFSAGPSDLIFSLEAQGRRFSLLASRKGIATQTPES